MGDTELSALRVLFDVSNTRAEWAEWAVGAGLLIELGVLFAFSKGMDKAEKVALVLANVVIVLGVITSSHFTEVAAGAATKLQQDATTTAASANLRAATIFCRAGLCDIGNHPSLWPQPRRTQRRQPDCDERLDGTRNIAVAGFPAPHRAGRSGRATARANPSALSPRRCRADLRSSGVMRDNFLRLGESSPLAGGHHRPQGHGRASAARLALCILVASTRHAETTTPASRSMSAAKNFQAASRDVTAKSS